MFSWLVCMGEKEEIIHTAHSNLEVTEFVKVWYQIPVVQTLLLKRSFKVFDSLKV